jgi:hypothetical protein
MQPFAAQQHIGNKGSKRPFAAICPSGGNAVRIITGECSSHVQIVLCSLLVSLSRHARWSWRRFAYFAVEGAIMSIDKSRPAFPRLPGVTRAAEIRVPSVETKEARQRHPLGLTLALAGLAVGLSGWALFTPAVWALAGFFAFFTLISLLPPSDQKPRNSSAAAMGGGEDVCVSSGGLMKSYMSFTETDPSIAYQREYTNNEMLLGTPENRIVRGDWD